MANYTTLFDVGDIVYYRSHRDLYKTTITAIHIIDGPDSGDTTYLYTLADGNQVKEADLSKVRETIVEVITQEIIDNITVNI